MRSGIPPPSSALRLALPVAAAAAAAASPCRGGHCRNVVYILSDDMRADWGVYGLPVHTPHLDALASEALRFRHAYCQISVCAPSRQSFMTGLRPDTHRVWNFEDVNPEAVPTTPGHFRDHGYLTLGLGKTFHQEQGAWNAGRCWSNITEFPYFRYSDNHCAHGSSGGGHCLKGDDGIWDAHLLNITIAYLEYAIGVRKARQQPFFIMTGFRDPHAPWVAPQRMYDLYKDNASISIAASPNFPKDAPQVAFIHNFLVRLEGGQKFAWSPTEAAPDWVQRDQRQAYYAAVSYVDEHVGAIVAALRSGGVYNDTIVVFHSDHGYHLGEHGMWEKKSNFDLAVRVPLLIRAPGRAAAGAATGSVTELVDVFPTLAAAAGLPPPPGVDGADVSALLDDPALPLKAAAYHQYPACGTRSLNRTRKNCNNVAPEEFTFMGYSVRTPEWRYTAWYAWDQAGLSAVWDGGFAEELYDHAGDDSTDMDRWENENVAAAHPAVAARLRAQLRGFFSGAGNGGGPRSGDAGIGRARPRARDPAPPASYIV